MTAIQPDKYHVHHAQADRPADLLEPGGYFVLRRGDILATATLRSYASNALTMLELESVGVALFTNEQREHLLELADYATELATEWEQAKHKLPD